MNAIMNELFMDDLTETAIMFDANAMQNIIMLLNEKSKEANQQRYLNEVLMDGLIETAIPVDIAGLSALLNNN